MGTEAKNRGGSTGSPNEHPTGDNERAEIRPPVIRGRDESDFDNLERRLRRIAVDATVLMTTEPAAASSRVRALALMWAAVDELEVPVRESAKVAYQPARRR